MIAALPLRSDTEKSAVSLKFARCQFFAIIDKERKTCTMIRNKYFAESSQVGKQVYSELMKHKVNTLIAYELGLKVQQMANRKKHQLIILNQKKTQLKDLLNLMRGKDETRKWKIIRHQE